MTLLFLLFLPMVLALVAFYTGRGKITWKELLVHEGVLLLIIGVGYAIGLSNRSSDVEHWNGRIAKKWQDTGSCCHSYQCNCYQSCSGSGTGRSCSTVCSTCYEHARDQEWHAITTNNETAYSQNCGRPGTSAPDRWQAIVVGEPTSMEHDFTNYIKGNPDSILRRQGRSEPLKLR
jgi:hypothetical protein